MVDANSGGAALPLAEMDCGVRFLDESDITCFSYEGYVTTTYVGGYRRHELFYSFFKTLVGKEIAVELKNDVALTGTLHSVDQYLNVKLTDVHVVDAERYPQLGAIKNCFIRGSVVRYIQIPSADVDTELLQDACRKESAQGK